MLARFRRCGDERASDETGGQSAVSSSISAEGALVWTDLIPFIADDLLAYASLVAMTWPLPATRLKWNLPVEPFLSTNFQPYFYPLIRNDHVAAEATFPLEPA